jgi:hypothetical protein
MSREQRLEARLADIEREFAADSQAYDLLLFNERWRSRHVHMVGKQVFLHRRTTSESKV